jgi:hypothetical protein
MNAGRAFDRDVSRGSTGDPMIDNIRFRKEGRADFSISVFDHSGTALHAFNNYEQADAAARFWTNL